ncbi:MAG: Trm112 family protein [Anaerolineae bacterium]
MIAPELLAILRCPACVSGPTRRPGDDPGRLELVRESWLVCQEPGCGRKYPIVDDIPVMLIETGDKWINTAVADLPVPPPQM